MKHHSSSGLHSTRGLIVEGDGDDEKTFTFRALSRQNRQGFNVTGDGKLIWGAVKDTHRSRLYVEHNENDSPVITGYVRKDTFRKFSKFKN